MSIFLLFILISGVKRQNNLLSTNSTYYKSLNTDINTDINTSKNISEDGTFFNKINSGSDVNILLLGDDLLCGTTNNGNIYPFDSNLSDVIKLSYNANTKFNNLSKNNSTILTGNESIDKDTELTKYDLAIISFGYNDYNEKIPIDEFTQKYSDLICKIKSKNYNCTIISLLNPVLQNDNEYISQIKYICDINNIGTINLNTKFINSNYSYDNLLTNNLPNTNGYNLIIDSINNYIKIHSN